MHKLKRLTSLSVPVVLALAASAQQADVSATVSTGPSSAIQVAPAGGGTINGSVLLFDNGTWITQTGVGFGGADVSEIETGLNTFGLLCADPPHTTLARLADDFDVPLSGTWDIQTLTWRGYQTNASTAGTFTGATVQIWDGPPSSGTASVIAGDTTTNRYVSHVFTNVYRVTSTTLTSTARAVMDITVDMSWIGILPPGNYWIDIGLTGSTSFSGPWVNLTVPWDSADNGEQFFGGSWAMTSSGVGATPVDFPYLLDGTSGGGCSSDSITTLFVSNNGGSVGGMNYFDADVTNALTVTGLDVNTSAAAGTSIAIEVYTIPGTSVGNQTNMSLWTSVGIGNGVSNGTDMPTPVDVSDFSLAPGQYGIGIRIYGGALRYTNGTGTNQFFMNSDLSLTLGSATNVPFSGTPFTPRVWNGTIYYDLGGCCPVPSTYCTAQMNSLGCTPAISFSGDPGPSGGTFIIEANDVLPNVNGILAYSTFGNNNAAFMGGTLCIRTPITRTPVQQSTTNGSGTCSSGQFSFDFDALVASGSDPALVAGQQVWAQYWSRDPASATGSNLTDAITFVICP